MRKKREILWDKCKKTDSKNEELLLKEQIKEIAKRQIYCLKKEGQECNKLVVKNMNKDIDKLVMQKTQEQQLSLLQNHTEEQNIG